MASTETMERIMVFDRLDHYLCDIDPQRVREIPYVEEINGEHSITITTTQRLEKTNRVLVRDGMGIWHEYVVLGIADRHRHKSVTEAKYYCIWSLQYDLMCTFINGPYDCGVVPGHASVPQVPLRAMEVALGGTSRWRIGTITVTNMASASFYRRSGWEGLQTVVERWGGEVQATITVGADGVVDRAVDLLAHVGSSTATRRFDFGGDIASIDREVSDDMWPCRIVPLGKAQETENGGYTRRPSIESVNGGVMWIQDDDVAPYVRVPDGQGGYEYPTLIVENDTYEDPSDLLAWANAHVKDYTSPRVTYKAEVVQFVRAGLDPHGVALGDEIAVVDHQFGADATSGGPAGVGLRISARVVRREGNLIGGTVTHLTIGNLADSLGRHLAGVSRRVDQLSETVERSQQYQATSEYVNNLISRLNAEINATGGYTYLVPGIGAVTYDTAVSDPTDGDEASQVTEMRGGTLRFANTRTSGGDWDWRTVLTANGINGELVTALRAVIGYIESATGSTRIDLDNDTFRFPGIIYDPTAGALVLGFDGTPLIQNRITASGQSYLVNGAALAEYGVEGNTSKMWAQIVSVLNRLEFGNFAWIARQNGNMTLKWIGE